MTTLQTLTIVITIGLLSCDNHRMEATVDYKNLKVDTALTDNTLPSEQKVITNIPYIGKKIEVDDYQVTNEMLSQQRSDDYSSYKKESGETYSTDKAWFSNDSLKQTLVFELYTDYHRLTTYHFSNTDIPKALIDRINLQTKDGNIATHQQKQKDFNGFLKQATNINSYYFVSNKGLRLGDTKGKATNIYGKPDKFANSNGVEKFEWDFIGDILYDGKTDLKGKPLAKDNFGHQVIMFFKNNKLIGQVLHNDIP